VRDGKHNIVCWNCDGRKVVGEPDYALTCDICKGTGYIPTDAPDSLIDYDAPLTVYDQEHIAILERLLRQEAEIARLKDELGACEAEANDTSVEHVMALEQEREAAKAEAALWSLSGEVFSQQTLKLAAAEMVIESGKAYIAELQAERAAALADAAALRGKLQEVVDSSVVSFLSDHPFLPFVHTIINMKTLAQEALANTTAGADLLARLQRAEAANKALVEAAKSVLKDVVKWHPSNLDSYIISLSLHKPNSGIEYSSGTTLLGAIRALRAAVKAMEDK